MLKQKGIFTSWNFLGAYVNINYNLHHVEMLLLIFHFR